jgi:quercetin dioxygenase-like cupin family protein
MRRQPQENSMAQTDTKNEGAIKAGEEGYFFNMNSSRKIAAGPTYSTSHGAVVEGDRMQIGLIHKARGTGSRPHSHPNEQFNYVLQGTLRVKVGDSPETLCPAGTAIFVPANTVHSMIATPEEDVIFYVVKDLSHGISGIPADGKESGPHFEPGFSPKKSAG